MNGTETAESARSGSTSLRSPWVSGDTMSTRSRGSFSVGDHEVFGNNSTHFYASGKIVTPRRPDL
ncbi:hypothetical protein ABZX85_39670 [Streptomyces sp. NPDC004539]|uniref:hypothetical protein n=1 Tax=Streptomyces sp. NPDC004539 TaxID=3154280 RepID=UPI0033A91E77